MLGLSRSSRKHRTTLHHKTGQEGSMLFTPIQTLRLNSNWKDPVKELTIRRKAVVYRQDELIVSQLREPLKNLSGTIISEMRCLMASFPSSNYLLPRKIIKKAINKIVANERYKSKHINILPFLTLANSILRKSSNSKYILEDYSQCMRKQTYPPTVELMLLYLGVFLYSVNALYHEAEQCCKDFFDMIVRYKVEEYFIIYFIMQIRLKSNLSEWEMAIKYLTKLISFAWLYDLENLQIWCYFQFSRVFFFMEEKTKSESFKYKSEMNYLESKDSIYRELCKSRLKLELKQLWEGQINFSYNDVLDETRLVIPPKNKIQNGQYIKDQRKLQSSIKNIIEQCKIKHVNHLLNRVAETNLYVVQKAANSLEPTKRYGGNNFLLTHLSKNKNMKTYFRSRQNKTKESQKNFYTIENSQRNWAVLREMVKSIMMEIQFFQVQ